MNLYVIDTGFFKLDGGAMFGVVPKSIWQHLNPPDANNLCTWAMRCLLVEDGKRLLLIDCGLGNKQSEKFFSYYEPHGEASLLGSLKKHGFSPDDITDVLLTHLHFDHCGGAVVRVDDHHYRPQFRNATYWTHEAHWNNALHPNPREKASFLKENFVPIQENGQLQFAQAGAEIMPKVRVSLANGHTEGMFVTHIHYRDTVLHYVADLMPSAAHIPVPYLMAYDIQPLELMREKAALLEGVAQRNEVLFFEHDRTIACCTVQKTEKGIRQSEVLRLEDI